MQLFKIEYFGGGLWFRSTPRRTGFTDLVLEPLAFDLQIFNTLCHGHFTPVWFQNVYIKAYRMICFNMTNFFIYKKISHPRHRPFAPCLKCRARTSFPVLHTITNHHASQRSTKKPLSFLAASLYKCSGYFSLVSRLLI